MIGKALYAKLASVSAITALVGTRIYPELGPQKGKTFPMIVYSSDDKQEVEIYSGGTGLVSRRVTLACIDDDYAGAIELAEAVRAGISWAEGTWGTVTVQGCFPEGQTDDKLVGEGTEQQVLYVSEVDFLIWYESN